MNKGRRGRTSGTRQRAAAKRRKRDAEDEDNDVYFVPSSSSSSSSSSDVDEGGGRNTMQQPSQSSSIDDLLYGDIFAHGKRNKRRDLPTTQEDTNAKTDRMTASKVKDTIQTIDIDNIKSSASSREVSKSQMPHAQSESVAIYSGGSAEAMPQPQPSPTPRPLEELRRMSSMEVRARLTNFFNKKDSCATHFAQATAQLLNTTEGTSSKTLEVTEEDLASNSTSMSVSAQRQRDRAARLVNVSNWDSGADAVNDVLLPAALVPQSSYYTTTSHTTRNNNTNSSNEQLVRSTSSTITALSGRTLRPHQIAGIRFLWSILAEGPVGQVPAVGCILAHTMGLGKTAQVIVFLHLFLASFAPRPNATRPTPFINSAFDIKDEDDDAQNAYRPQRVLIVVPKSTLPGWTDEFTRWSAAFPLPYRITPRTLEGAKPGQRVALYRQWRREGGVLLVGYEALVKLLQLLEEDEVLAQAESTQLFGLAGHRKTSRRSGRTHDTTNSASPMQLAVSARQAMRARHNDEGNMIYGSVDDPFTELVICDEAHRLKSVHLRVVTALRGLHPLRRLLLTGTPLQNHLGEYWAMVDFAVHGYFDRRRFRDFFVQPIESSLDRRASAREVDEARKKTFTLIREVRHFVQRVDSTPLRQELPPLYEYICVLPLSALQKELYLRFLATVQRSGGDGFQFLPAVSIAGKIAAHPQLLFNLHERQQKGQPRKNIEEEEENGEEKVTNAIAEPGSPLEEDEDEITQLVHLSLSQTQRFVQYDELCKPPRGGYVPRLQDGVKLHVALRLMQAAKRMNEKTLMFSLSTALLDFMEKLIAEANQQVTLPADMIRYSRLDGSHTSAQRAVLLRDFNASAGPDVFLLSMKAGGIGVTITSATRVILVDTSFNPADDQQAIGRAYRYGQTKPVYVYRLLCYQTLEYSIFEQKLAKEWLFKTVVEETTVKRDRLSGMHVKEVLALLNRAGKALRRPAEATTAQAQATRAVLQEDPLLHAVQAELLYAQPYGTFLEDDHDDQYGEAEQQYYREFQRNMLFDLAGSDAADARAEAEAAELARMRRAAEMQQQARTLTSMVDDLIRSGAGSNPQLTRLLSAMGLQIDPVSGHLRNMSQTTSTPQVKADNDSDSGVVVDTSSVSRPAVVAGATKSRVPAVEKAAPVKAEQRVENTHTNPPPVILVDSDEDSTAPASQGVLVDPARYAPFRPGASSSNAIDIDSTQ